MPEQLRISLGQHSEAGRKSVNQDFHGACIPNQLQLDTKGIAIALADGISSSEVSRMASSASVQSFLEDYYCTSQAWSVKTSAQRVLTALNSWLHAQNQQGPYRYDRDRGYVCTFSAMVLKSTTAHLFHVGDARIYRLHEQSLEQLTHDHRRSISPQQSYLARALGIDPHLEIDYHTLSISAGDTFLLATDGVYEFITPQLVLQAIADNPQSLDAAARAIAAAAYANGSPDNLTAQLVRIDATPAPHVEEIQQRAAELAFPPVLEAGMRFDGYLIQRVLHSSHRSHVYLACDPATDLPLVIKAPSIELREQAVLLERFFMEEWIARRISSPHIVKVHASTRERSHLYVAMEHIEGQTLRQWLLDQPRPLLETVRGVAEQIAKGLQALHRMEMLHQDLRPANVMIDRHGTVKLIDLGSASVAGLAEMGDPSERTLLGTAQYTAPEYFLGEAGSPGSDLFSLGVMVYEMLSGQLPYGARVASCRTRAAQRRLQYRSVLDAQQPIPVWLDAVLRRATHPDPLRRYAELSEFIHDLRHPNPAYLAKGSPALLERNPVAFWRTLTVLLALIIVLLLKIIADAP